MMHRIWGILPNFASIFRFFLNLKARILDNWPSAQKSAKEIELRCRFSFCFRGLQQTWRHVLVSLRVQIGANVAVMYPVCGEMPTTVLLTILLTPVSRGL